MRKSKYSEQQIVDALRRAESGVAVKDVYRELGVSATTFYQWRSKYGGDGGFGPEATARAG
ncbi:transposase [Marichromatium gracile]|uniref:transposase n=1 Tax=Marichromatium gracile TaxID=1048 RepID=UPI0013666C95|nr:transposase [Marichromatium gracile]